MENPILPSGKRLHNELERSTMLLMGKSTISMAIFYVANCKRLPEGTNMGKRETKLNC
jgi:hypothetical protein